MNLVKSVRVLTIAAFSVCSFNAISAPEGMYVGGSIGAVFYEKKDFSDFDEIFQPDETLDLDSDKGDALLGVNVGYRINQNWAINLDVDHSEFSDSYYYRKQADSEAIYNDSFETTNVRPEVHLIWPVTNSFDIYGLVGINFAFSKVETYTKTSEFQTDFSSDVEESELSQRTWSVTPAIGVGAQWQFSDHWSLKGEATYYDVDFVIDGDSYDTSHTSVMVGVDYHFS